jgi:hypothetical protein
MNDNKKVLEWFNNFTDYIQNNNTNLYNQACKYADDIENEETTDNGYNVEQVKEYYLNSGFTKYLEEPFLSEYSNLDWIEYANETELEL